MTDKIKDEITQDDDSTKQPELTQEEKDAEAGFAAGFAKARGEEPPAEAKVDEPTTGEPATAEQKPAAEPAKPDAAAVKAAAPDPWKDVPPVVRQELEALRALPIQIRNLAGHIGGLNSKLESALATAKAAATEKAGAGAAPSEKQIQAAMANPDAWKKLKEDYPDWAEPLEQEFGRVRGEIAELAKKTAPAVDVSALKTEVTSGVNAALAAGFDAAEERAFVRLKHPEWKTTVNTPEFKAWTLEGGPSVEAYSRMKTLEQTDQARADAIVNGWARQFPQWWADRGAAIFDERAEGAIKLLDGFKTYQEQAKTSAAKRQSNTTRLERSVPAQGTSGAPPSMGISDEQAFTRGFNRVRGGMNK